MFSNIFVFELGMVKKYEVNSCKNVMLPPKAATIGA